MDYEKAMQWKRDYSSALKRNTRRLGFETLRTLQSLIERSVDARIAGYRKDSAAFRHLPPHEINRIARQLLTEERATRALSAGVARFNVEPHIAKLDAQLRAYIAQRKRDVSLSFEHAHDHFRPADMVNLALLREARRAALAHATPAALLQCYQEAFERRDAVGLVDAELIEARVARGGLASSEDDLPAVRELAEAIDAVQDLRVEPNQELRELAEIIEDAKRAINRADAAQVQPRNPEHDVAAKLAHEATEPEFRAALEAEANAAAAGAL